jgi:hypothetical protein
VGRKLAGDFTDRSLRHSTYNMSFFLNRVENGSRGWFL